MDNTTINTAAENQQANTQPEDNSKQQRTFTQEEVNKIVSDRLERERNKKADNSEYETRMNELNTRENAFACKEFVKSENLPDELLEMFDTTDSEKFKETVRKIDAIYCKRYRPSTTGVRTNNVGGNSGADLIADAFRRK